MALRLVLSIPMADIMAFRKLSRAYFNLMEVLAHSHTATVVSQVGRYSVCSASCKGSIPDHGTRWVMLVTPASHAMSPRASWWLCWLGRHACVCYAPVLLCVHPRT